MKPRDALIGFHHSSPDFVQVSEMIDGEKHPSPGRPTRPNVVTEMEERYMFFTKQADAAREQVTFGRSCVFNVYRREPSPRVRSVQDLCVASPC
jgi:hypothetical protein